MSQRASKVKAIAARKANQEKKAEEEAAQKQKGADGANDRLLQRREDEDRLDKDREKALICIARVDIDDEAKPVVIEKNRVNTRGLIPSHVRNLMASMEGGQVLDTKYPLRVMAMKSAIVNLDQDKLLKKLKGTTDSAPLVKWDAKVCQEHPPSILAGGHRRQAALNLITREAGRMTGDDISAEDQGRLEAWMENYKVWHAEIYDEEMLMADVTLREYIAANPRDPQAFEQPDEGMRGLLKLLRERLSRDLDAGKVQYGDLHTIASDSSEVHIRPALREVWRSGWTTEWALELAVTFPSLVDTAMTHPNQMKDAFWKRHGRSGDDWTVADVFAAYKTMKAEEKEQEEWDKEFEAWKRANNVQQRKNETTEERKARREKEGKYKAEHPRPDRTEGAEKWAAITKGYRQEPAPKDFLPIMADGQVEQILSKAFTQTFGTSSTGSSRRNDLEAFQYGTWQLDERGGEGGVTPALLIYFDNVRDGIAEVWGTDDKPKKIKGFTPEEVEAAYQSMTCRLAIWACDCVEEGSFMGLACQNMLEFWTHLLDEIPHAMSQAIVMLEPGILIDKLHRRDGWRDFSNGLYEWTNFTREQSEKAARSRRTTDNIFRRICRFLMRSRYPHLLLLEHCILTVGGPFLDAYDSKTGLADFMDYVNEYDPSDLVCRIMGWPVCDAAAIAKGKKIAAEVDLYLRSWADVFAEAGKAARSKAKTDRTAEGGNARAIAAAQSQRPITDDHKADYPAAHVALATSMPIGASGDAAQSAERRAKSFAFEAWRSIIWSRRVYASPDVQAFRSNLESMLRDVFADESLQLWERDLHARWDLGAIEELGGIAPFDFKDIYHVLLQRVEEAARTAHTQSSLTQLYSSMISHDLMYVTGHKPTGAQGSSKPTATNEKSLAELAARIYSRGKQVEEPRYIECIDAADNLINLLRINSCVKDFRQVSWSRSVAVDCDILPPLNLPRPRTTSVFDPDITNSSEEATVELGHLSALLRAQYARSRALAQLNNRITDLETELKAVEASVKEGEPDAEILLPELKRSTMFAKKAKKAFTKRDYSSELLECLKYSVQVLLALDEHLDQGGEIARTIRAALKQSERKLRRDASKADVDGAGPRQRRDRAIPLAAAEDNRRPSSDGEDDQSSDDEVAFDATKLVARKGKQRVIESEDDGDVAGDEQDDEEGEEAKSEDGDKRRKEDVDTEMRDEGSSRNMGTWRHTEEVSDDEGHTSQSVKWKRVLFHSDDSDADMPANESMRASPIDTQGNEAAVDTVAAAAGVSTLELSGAPETPSGTQGPDPVSHALPGDAPAANPVSALFPTNAPHLLPSSPRGPLPALDDSLQPRAPLPSAPPVASPAAPTASSPLSSPGDVDMAPSPPMSMSLDPSQVPPVSDPVARPATPPARTRSDSAVSPEGQPPKKKKRDTKKKVKDGNLSSASLDGPTAPPVATKTRGNTKGRRGTSSRGKPSGHNQGQPVAGPSTLIVVDPNAPTATAARRMRTRSAEATGVNRSLQSSTGRESSARSISGSGGDDDSDKHFDDKNQMYS
ncbi:hypothetical protein K488DRAFT_69845 [Vararia minispora EC-137]|uniref:Uncharacterized protein n=1 Tax=Vararia minispora EC-137 TaxID=1314806 RepID=A0ACB8QQ38_9AGAM|nr:hypothetical protein K488DRAFT_69845 [Vararia minispora EC-137]